MNRFAPTLSDAEFAALPLAERFVLVAAFYADKAKVEEHPRGSNRGEYIDAWAKEFDTLLGSPWCGLYVSHCLRAAGYKGSLPPHPASTHSWADWAHSHGKSVNFPQRGDIFVLLFTPTTGHMGIVLGPTVGTRFRTAEGNSNNDGSREGYAVVRHERSITPGAQTVIVRLTD
jgi:hypothetical protein